jgi:hypothetical protein
MAGNRSRLRTDEYPRPRRASRWLITHSPKLTLTLLNDTPTVQTSRPSHTRRRYHRNAVKPTASDASIGSQFRTLPTGTKTPRSCRLAPCLVFKYEAISHTQKDQSQIVRCSEPLPSIAKNPIPRVRRWVNQIHGSANLANSRVGWSQFNGTRKNEADRWERPAFFSSPRGSLVEALGVCGKGFNERPGSRWRTSGALVIARATCSGTCNVAYLP